MEVLFQNAVEAELLLLSFESNDNYYVLVKQYEVVLLPKYKKTNNVAKRRIIS